MRTESNYSYEERDPIAEGREREYWADDLAAKSETNTRDDYAKFVAWLGSNPNPAPLSFEKWLAMERKWGRRK
mgnify:CR=1 FL=1